MNDLYYEIKRFEIKMMARVRRRNARRLLRKRRNQQRKLRG